jgi:hypothetical protein
MKMLLKIGILTMMLSGATVACQAQVQEAIQLALNIEKLNQLRQILQNMYKAYTIISGGYNKVKDITSGNYKIHEAFMDGLMAVNPKIKNYRRVAGIIQAQGQLLKEYKAAYNRFSGSGMMRPEELEYLMDVYGNLVEQSLQHLDELTMILTSGNFKMTDDERLEGIDRINDQMQDKLSFLRSFNNKTSVLVFQRSKQHKEVQMFRQLYNLKPE